MNGIGLGHVSRLAAIALAIRQRDPNLAQLFAVEGDSHGLLEAANLAHITFPSSSRLHSNNLNSWSRARREILTKSIAELIVDFTNPDLIVFDCFPNRLLTTIARTRKIPFAICVRKCKDMEGYFKGFGNVLEEAKSIVIPHSSGELNIPVELASKSYFVGSIVRPLIKTPNPVSGFDHQRRVVITGGGGGYPGTVSFYNLALEAIAKSREIDPALTGLLVTGPLFNEWKELRLVSGVSVIPFDPDITALFRAAPLVLCQAGYNTVAEVTALGVSAICIPAHRNFDDQHERARRMSDAYGQFWLLEDPNSDSLSALISKILQMAPAANTITSDSDGSRLAADVLIKCIDRGKK